MKRRAGSRRSRGYARGRRMLAVGVALAAGVTGLTGVERARADLTIDLRAVARNGQPLITPDDQKNVAVQAGDVVTLDLFARINGTNGANDETVLSAYGSLISAGSRLGTLAGGVVAPFNSTGFQNGTQVDLDSDSDLDIGAPIGSTGGAVSGYFLARSLFAQPGNVIVDANTSEIRIGSFTFTVAGGGNEVLLNFVRRTDAIGGDISAAASWFEDGTPKSPTSSTYKVGTPVRATVPEPTGVAISSAAMGLGLLSRRRGESHR